MILELKTGIVALGISCFVCLYNLSFSQNYSIYKCQGPGYFGGYSATINVTCKSKEYGAWDQSGDEIDCNGTIDFGNLKYQFSYGGFVNLAPYKGLLRAPDGEFLIKVLDNSEGRFQIYQGGYSTGAPDLYGEFQANWRRIR